MSISVSCPCGKTLSVKDELAGKHGKCPACGAPMTIPALTVPSPAPSLNIPAAILPAVAVVPTLPQLGPPHVPGSPVPYHVYPPNPAAVPLPPAAMAIPVVQPLPAWAYPVNNVAVTPVIPEVVGFTPATRSLGGPVPPPLELAPLPGGYSSGAKPPILAAPVEADPLAAMLGTDSTGSPSGAGAHYELEGSLLCPHCNRHLQSTHSAENSLLQIFLGVFVGFYFVPSTPYRCSYCGPIAANQLRGASLRTAQKSSRNFAVAWVLGIVFIFIIAAGLIFSKAFEPNRGNLPREPSPQQLIQEQSYAEMNRLNEKNRQEQKKRLQEMNRQQEISRQKNEKLFKESQEIERREQERLRRMLQEGPRRLN